MAKKISNILDKGIYINFSISDSVLNNKSWNFSVFPPTLLPVLKSTFVAQNFGQIGLAVCFCQF